jgi:hypothetical protein
MPTAFAALAVISLSAILIAGESSAPKVVHQNEFFHCIITAVSC